MNILLLNHYAGSPAYGMEFRPYYLAKEWIKAGHKVLIVGGSFSHLRKTQPVSGFETIDGVDYLWLKTNTYKVNGVLRFCSMFIFVWQLYRRRKLFRKFKPDAVIASSTYPLDIYPAHRIAKDNHAKLVFEIHDLWPLSPMELGGMSKYHPFIVIMQWAENYAYKHCDKCMSLLSCVHKHVKKHGLDLEKLVLIPNGVALEDWESPEELNPLHVEILQKIKEQNKTIVGYAGGHSTSTALNYLIDAASLSDPSVFFVLVGNGQEKENLKKQAKKKGVENILFLDPVPKRQIPNLLKMLDILYIGGNPSPLYRFGISPNKLFDYMMSKKPIILSLSAGNDLVQMANCGLTVTPENPRLIVDAIVEMQQMGKDKRDLLGMNGYLYVTKRHTYNVLSSTFLNALNT